MFSKRTERASLLLAVTCNHPSRSHSAALTVPTEALTGDIDGDYISYFEDASARQWVFVGPLFDASCRLYSGDDRWEPVGTFDTREQVEATAATLSNRLGQWLMGCWEEYQIRRDAVMSGRRQHLREMTSSGPVPGEPEEGI